MLSLRSGLVAVVVSVVVGTLVYLSLGLLDNHGGNPKDQVRRAGPGPASGSSLMRMTPPVMRIEQEAEGRWPRSRTGRGWRS